MHPLDGDEKRVEGAASTVASLQGNSQHQGTEQREINELTVDWVAVAGPGQALWAHTAARQRARDSHRMGRRMATGGSSHARQRL